jgi:hypothetical protein
MLLSDFAEWFSVLAGAATGGAILAGPVGAVIGLFVGIGLRLGATGRLPRRQDHPQR